MRLSVEEVKNEKLRAHEQRKSCVLVSLFFTWKFLEYETNSVEWKHVQFMQQFDRKNRSNESYRSNEQQTMNASFFLHFFSKLIQILLLNWKWHSDVSIGSAYSILPPWNNEIIKRKGERETLFDTLSFENVCDCSIWTRMIHNFGFEKVKQKPKQIEFLWQDFECFLLSLILRSFCLLSLIHSNQDLWNEINEWLNAVQRIFIFLLPKK